MPPPRNVTAAGEDFNFTCPDASFLSSFSGRFSQADGIIAIGPLACSNGATSLVYGGSDGSSFINASNTGYTNVGISWSTTTGLLSSVTLQGTTWGATNAANVDTAVLLCPGAFQGTVLAGVFGKITASARVTTLGLICRQGERASHGMRLRAGTRPCVQMAATAAVLLDSTTRGLALHAVRTPGCFMCR